MDGPLSPNKDAPQRWYNAAIPFLLIIVLTFFGMINDGISKLDLIYPNASHSSYSLLTILSHSDSVGALIQSSASGCFVAMVLVIVQKILTLNQTVSAWIQGVNDILEPTIILLLAWALGTVIQDIQIAPYLATIIEGNVSPGSLPAITAILCYIVSFATGSGFGTMAIMFPIVRTYYYLSISPNHRSRHSHTKFPTKMSTIYSNALVPSSAAPPLATSAHPSQTRPSSQHFPPPYRF